jgi:hypothetical protein
MLVISMVGAANAADEQVLEAARKASIASTEALQSLQAKGPFTGALPVLSA